MNKKCWLQAPFETTFVYRYEEGGKIVYVGITRDLQARINQHRHDGLSHLKNPVIRYFCARNRADAELLEWFLINYYETGRFYNRSKVLRQVPTILESAHFPWQLYTGADSIKRNCFFDLQATPAQNHQNLQTYKNLSKAEERVKERITECVDKINCISQYIDNCDGREVELGITPKNLAIQDKQNHEHLLELLNEWIAKGRNRRDIVREIDKLQRKINEFYANYGFPKVGERRN